MKYLPIAIVVVVGISGMFGSAGLPWAEAQVRPPVILPEQRRIAVRDPAQLPPVALREVAPPSTVRSPQGADPVWNLTLDQAIQIALRNSEVIRVLGGAGGASSSGRTVYQPAIANAAIDQQQGRFDPQLRFDNTYNQLETPAATFDPLNAGQSLITGTRRNDYNTSVAVSKMTNNGGQAQVSVNANPSRLDPGVFPLNPQTRSSLELSYTHPFLFGGGIAANQAPILLARIDTERSFFQLKDSLQELVRGVVDGYWSLVFARTDFWARQQQVEQGRFAYERAKARKEKELSNLSEVAQTRLAYYNFRASLIGAQANLLQREAALRNLLGLPPTEARKIIPVTLPNKVWNPVSWERIRGIAAERRPDIIELKLVLEADQQLLIQARNQALPSLDGVMLYRWNGLSGVMPSRAIRSSRGGQFADWTLGVNFSVPLGLRQGRATIRRQDLVIARDRALLDQQVHNTTHVLAANLRNLAQFFEQYQAFRETRQAARENLEQQAAEYRTGTAIFLNVLSAITDWGNAVNAEAQALLQYNAELANLERQTGTILESHGVRMLEERYAAAGPLSRWHPACYPRAMRPTGNEQRYPRGEEPSEDSFNLEPPFQRKAPVRPPYREPLPVPNLPANLPAAHSE